MIRSYFFIFLFIPNYIGVLKAYTLYLFSFLFEGNKGVSFHYINVITRFSYVV